MNRILQTRNHPEVTACPDRAAISLSAWLAILAPVLCLLPFLDKPFHIDDPVYLWVAQQIQQHPLDFYGFVKNWSLSDAPMYEINKNPPGVSYFIALAAALVGWSEIALHAIFLLPLLALSVGVYRLAEQLCTRPALATVLAMLAPVTLVSSSNVMSDTLTLALAVWAAIYWLRGLDRAKASMLFIAMTLASLAILTKYLAISFLPLFIAYALMKRRPLKSWAPTLLVPVFIVGAYQFWYYRLYGMNPFAGAASFAAGFDEPGRAIPPGARFTIGLSFLGGCYIASLFLLPLLWQPKHALVVLAIPLTSLLALFTFGNDFAQSLIHPAYTPATAFHIQLALFSSAGFAALALATCEIWRNRDPESTLLALWIFGFFVFSTFINWTVNGRTMLPMAPAVGILLARNIGANVSWRSPLLIVPVSASALIALAVLWSDVQLARAGKTAGANFADDASAAPANIWIQGDWGSRWYFEQAGAQPFDTKLPSLRVGDTVIQSSNNFVYPLPPELAQRYKTDNIPAGRWLTTMDRSLGAGFYSSVWGPLPYAFGRVPDERYYYLRIEPR